MFATRSVSNGVSISSFPILKLLTHPEMERPAILNRSILIDQPVQPFVSRRLAANARRSGNSISRAHPHTIYTIQKE